jgi:TonB family protein
MNRLQKKCVIGTVGIHLLLFLILIVGPAFYNQQPKTDDMQVLDVIPANLVDAAVSSGVKNAQPPPPTPVRPQPPQPQFAPPPPRIVQPPAPTPTFLEKVERYLSPKPAPSVTPDLTPAEKRVKSHDNKIKIDLTKVTRTSVPKNTTTTDNSANAREINRELRSLKTSLSSSTKIDMPGSADAAYANYGDVVISVYNSAWQPPVGMAEDSVNVLFKVTIARDGTVISAHIVTSSGDPNVDAAVQSMLDRVTFIAPFPNGATEKERTYPVNFNATRTSE